MDWSTIIAINVVLFVVGLLHVLTGFGYAILGTPILALLLGPKTAALYIMVTGFLIKVPMVVQTYRFVDRHVLVPIVVGVTLGSLPGAYILKIISGAQLKLLLAFMLAVALVLMGREIYFPVKNLRLGRFVTGLVGGVLNAATSVSGPVLMVWFHNEHMLKDAMRAHVLWTFIFSSALSFGSSMLTGVVAQHLTATGVLACMPGMALGYLAGDRLYGRIDQARFRQLILFVIFVGMCTMLYSGWQEL